MNGYTPQVGDRVRMRGWGSERWLDVSAIDRGYLFGFDQDDDPTTWNAAHFWVKVPEPIVYPELWVNIDASAYPSAYLTRGDADVYAHTGRIAVIHLATDGTLTLHPDDAHRG
jgi:hypothetical protein